MSKQKILVIGSNSFSGSHFVSESIRNDFLVWGVSRSLEPLDIFLPYKWNNNISENFSYNIINLNTQLEKLIELIDSVEPEYIVNFAAQGMVAESWQNPTDWYKTNVLSQVAFHDKLRKRKFIKKYVHVTTPEVYGNTGEKWIKEHNCFSPTTPYAVSRASCDLHLHSFYKAYEFPVVFTRAANVYGPGQQLYRIIPRTLLSTLTHEKMQLHGGGASKRSFIHISDVVKATLKLAVEAPPGSSWHISTTESITIKNLVKKICSIANVKFSSIVDITDDRLGKDQNYLLDSSSIRKEFGWSPKIDLDEGISETLDWVDSNLDKLKKIPWKYIHKS
mgnify:CR=1 FL=1|tara:strand:+ start:555 stop:1556 length:1002 start_codon:yes stop_codon:yes gene_type:complete